MALATGDSINKRREEKGLKPRAVSGTSVETDSPLTNHQSLMDEVHLGLCLFLAASGEWDSLGLRV